MDPMKRRTTKKLMKQPRRPLADFEAEHGPLSDEERGLLSDPRGITEDEDDIIMIRRQDTGASLVDLEQVLARSGLKRVRFHGRTHLARSRGRVARPGEPRACQNKN